DHEVDDAGAVHADRLRAHPVGGPAGLALLVEALAVDAVRKAHDGERAPGEVGEDRVRDLGVVRDRLALGGPRLRPEDLVEVREGEGAPLYFDFAPLFARDFLLPELLLPLEEEVDFFLRPLAFEPLFFLPDDLSLPAPSGSD